MKLKNEIILELVVKEKEPKDQIKTIKLEVKEIAREDQIKTIEDVLKRI